MLELRAIRIDPSTEETGISVAEALAYVAEYTHDNDIDEARRSVEQSLRNAETCTRFAERADYRFFYVNPETY